MKIAATYDNGNIFQHFGKTEFFKVYEVEDNKVISSEVISSNGTGHGALAGLLADQGISVLICGGIGGGAQAALAEAGVELCSGAQGDVDAAVDAYLKGIGNFDPKKALEACVATANIDEYRGIGLYKKYGYVPYDVTDHYNSENWSLSKTLEYAYDDYCIARMADKLGERQIADAFYKRSQNYKNVYNPQASFMQPRDNKGNFIQPFSPDDYTPHICESNGWQYFWSVQQDVDGLIGLVGGTERFAQKLDSMFTYNPSADEDLPIFSTGMIGQYAHGNEPSHHVIYLFNAVGQPWKTQKYAAEVMHELYKNTPAGLCGNEDCGQMSAWYVFSAMGFYPVDPVSGRYEIGTPMYPEMKMHLDNGKTFTVLAPTVSEENIYIQSVKLDGKPYDKSYITHEQIMNGSVFEFEMGNKPGAVWYAIE